MKCRARLLPLIALPLLCAGCAVDELAQPIFEQPDSVLARRLTLEGKPIPQSDQAVPVTREQARRLVNLLRQARQATGDLAKKCAPQPGVAVEFSKGVTTRQILLCFECDMYGMSANMKNWHNFDARRKDLIDWVKPIFPKDQEIQKLKAR